MSCNSTDSNSKFRKMFVGVFLQLAMASPRWQVIHKLKLAKFVDKIGTGCVFLTVAEAMDGCLASKCASISNC